MKTLRDISFFLFDGKCIIFSQYVKVTYNLQRNDYNKYKSGKLIQNKIGCVTLSNVPAVSEYFIRDHSFFFLFMTVLYFS